MKPHRITVLIFILLCTGCSEAPQRTSDASELLRLHASLIDAHLNADVEAWLAIEADSMISANNGRVTFPSVEERRDGRTAYLKNATFDQYRDIREPIVRVSDDGSQGWLIAEVEVVGTYQNPDGSTEEISDIWAWIELYERTRAGWKLVGNVSNRRPLAGTQAEQ